MTTDPRDAAIGVSCPVVAVPRFGALEPHASGQRMLLARNGLFVQMKTPWLDCTTRVAEIGMHLPYGAAAEAIAFAFGVIPLGLLERFIAAARRDDAQRGGWRAGLRRAQRCLRLAMHEAIEVRPGREVPDRRVGRRRLVAIDLHSHGRLAAFWSGEDDRDDQGVRVCGVFGNLDRERPTASSGSR
jgi:PRTRC genetic system protein A